MKIYYIYYYNRFIIMGCDDEAGLSYLVDEVRKAFDIKYSEDAEVRELDSQGSNIHLIEGLQRMITTTGYYTKSMTQDEWEMVVDGYKYVRYQNFQSRKLKLDKFLGEE